ncbi:MAG TPA: hypothetical protein VFF69_13955 [Phycisphaerales bacterium]|nr:hypothetical protein [Phycisphaerales bacterium]
MTTSGGTSRREFLAVAGAAAGAAAAFPVFARTGRKSGLGPVILGEGDHQYECIHDWGELPARIRYGNTHGVCEDSQGRIYIKHTVHATSDSPDAVVVFDADGKFVTSWGAEFRGGAHGMHLNKEGSEEFLYLCDPSRGLVVKTTLDGKDVWRIGVPDASGLYDSAGEYHPTNIALAPSGGFYVGDGYGKSWIHQYNAKAEYVRSFGGPGGHRGQLSCPHGLMVDSRGAEPELIVADRSNRRIHRFSLDGRVLGLVTDELRSPCHFHTFGEDLVIPDLEARVTLFDKHNRLITHLGDGADYGLRAEPREKFIPGKFIAPHSAIFDHAGNIFVVEWVEVGRVTKLRRLA